MSSTIIPDSAISGKSTHAPLDEPEIETVGLLVKLSPQESLKQAMQRGLFTWQADPFHRNFTPTECRINSAESTRWHVEAGASLLGLTVVVAETVQKGHVRLCCLVAKG